MRREHDVRRFEHLHHRVEPPEHRDVAVHIDGAVARSCEVIEQHRLQRVGELGRVELRDKPSTIRQIEILKQDDVQAWKQMPVGIDTIHQQQEDRELRMMLEEGTRCQIGIRDMAARPAAPSSRPASRAAP